MSIKRCACCDQPFEPRPQIPNQAFCSAPACQRARKRHWQRSKIQTDTDYQVNQRDAQQAWSERNQDYWRNYRATHPEYQQRNREQQKLRDHSSKVDLAKMDVSDLPTGIYRITRLPSFASEDGTSWIVEITPICGTCPCKMDASREDLMDISHLRP